MCGRHWKTSNLKTRVNVINSIEKKLEKINVIIKKLVKTNTINTKSKKTYMDCSDQPIRKTKKEITPIKFVFSKEEF